MKQLIVIMLFFAVMAVAGVEAANLSLPDRDLPDAVSGSVDSMWGFMEWLEQIIDDLMAFIRDVLRYLELGSEYIERLMGVMDTGRDLVNKTFEQNSPPR